MLQGLSTHHKQRQSLKLTHIPTVYLETNANRTHVHLLNMIWRQYNAGLYVMYRSECIAYLVSLTFEGAENKTDFNTYNKAIYRGH